MDKNIAIMGGTGHIGQVVVDDLLKRGHTVRAIGRDERKLRHLLGKGAEIYLCDFDDPEVLTEAFSDCYSVFCMIPPNMTEDLGVYQDQVSKAICKALQNTRVKRVVNLSSLGAELKNGTGAIKGLHRQEERLNAISTITDLIHIRPSYFMENFIMSIPSIIYEDKISLPVSGNIPIAMVATRDIGWKVADFLERTDSVGRTVYDFVGPHALTLEEATYILGDALEKPKLKFVQNSFEDERDGLLKVGLHPDTVELLLEMYEAINEGKIRPTQKLTAEHHGTTTFEEFAKMFAHHMLSLAR